MRSLTEIRNRKEALEEKLTLVRKAIEVEMEKQMEKRDRKLLKFLATELKVFEFAMAEFVWLTID